MRILNSPVTFVKIPIRLKRSTILAVAVVSVIAIILACSIFVVDRSSAHSVSPAKKNQQGCCPGQQTTQVLYAPTTGLPGAGRAELALNNNRQDDLTITPTIYSKDGSPIVCDQITLRSMEVRRIPVADLATGLVDGVGNAGGISLSYLGGPRELRAQVALFGEKRAGSVDIPVTAATDYLSSIQEAVWWSPGGATATLALGNTSDSPIQVKLAFGSGEQREIQVGPFATETVTHKSRKSNSSAHAESVRLELSGAIGSLRAAGFVRSANMKFTSMIRFYDPQRARQPNLYTTNFRLKNSDPHVVLKNISNEQITATPKFLPLEGDEGNPLELAPVSLAPQEEREVDLAPLMEAAAQRKDFEMVSVQVLNSGPTSSLIGALCSIDKNSSMTYEAPLRDSGDMRRSTGTYPWRVDDDYSPLVTITNVSHVQTTFLALISYDGGQYMPKLQKLEAGATAVFDLNKMQREQIPDSHGQTIPQSVTHGQFFWSIITGTKETKLIGRMQLVSKENRASMSYSCESCCPLSFYEARVTPSTANVTVGGESGGLLVEERYFTNCNGTFWVSPWDVGLYSEFSNGQGEVESGDEEIATVSPSFQFPSITVTGVRGGTTNINITWEAPQWFFSGSFDACDVFLSPASTFANVNVQVPQVTFASSSLNSYSPTNGNSLSFTATISPSSSTGIIRFEIYDISAYTGDAMNRGTQTTPDYDFSGSQSGLGSPSTQGSGAGLVYTISTPSRASSATVNVYSRDYGGRCKIRVFATFGETEIAATFTGNSSTLARIPKDDNDNNLPDAGWTAGTAQINEQSTAPESDNDNNPAGAGTNGDGFTDFEEYRGVIVRGGHRRLNPFQKDLFILSELTQGIGDANNSPVTKHALSSGELDSGRVVNFNYINGGFGGNIPSHFNQHGQRIIDGGYAGFGLLGDAFVVGTPNALIRSIEVYTQAIREASPPTASLTTVETFDNDAIRSTIGHESGHGVSIAHYLYTPGGRLTVMVTGYLPATTSVTDPRWNSIPHNYDATDNGQIRIR